MFRCRAPMHRRADDNLSPYELYAARFQVCRRSCGAAGRAWPQSAGSALRAEAEFSPAFDEHSLPGISSPLAPFRLAGLGHGNRDGLLAAFHLAARAALEVSFLVFVHYLLDFAFL